MYEAPDQLSQYPDPGEGLLIPRSLAGNCAPRAEKKGAVYEAPDQLSQYPGRRGKGSLGDRAVYEAPDQLSQYLAPPREGPVEPRFATNA